MSIAVWKTEYLTGNLQVDQEHQQLFEIVNTLHGAILQKANYSELQSIFNHMASHTVAHFQSEESLMLAKNYPGFDRHKQAHDGLLTKVKTLLQQLDQQDLPPSVKLTEFLTEWLAHHIKGEDQKMIQFFRQQADLDQVASLTSSNA
jgi:hemerythrin